MIAHHAHFHHLEASKTDWVEMEVGGDQEGQCPRVNIVTLYKVLAVHMHYQNHSCCPPLLLKRAYVHHFHHFVIIWTLGAFLSDALLEFANGQQLCF